MKRTSPATIAEEVRLLLRYTNQNPRLLFYSIDLAFIFNELIFSNRRNGIAVCIEWVKQSLEYLSRKGLTSSNPESLSAKVYLLFLEADLHEISSEDGIFPHNVQLIESGMLSSSNEILVLQVRVEVCRVKQWRTYSSIYVDVHSRWGWKATPKIVTSDLIISSPFAQLYHQLSF